ncbi:HAT repeat protein [Dictyocaulus viviparus]|uniref:HAT repeat protein n=1 Tax=Dictyocaulus viviparus TaxID=29172 RepID=A0A0D8Y0R0_DICVI|nr:HAT repeat protein [Dictyocaulus viviparus]
MSDDEEPVSGNKPLRLPKKAANVKNKAPAQLQITAEQLLREAKERELELIPLPPKTKITDPDELAEFQRRKRKEFEDGIRKNRMQIANWIKYGKWEESIGEIQRSRSVFERALDVDHRSITIWYKEIDRARSIYQRFLHVHGTNVMNWIKYARFEEKHGYVGNARAVYERGMEYFGEENINEKLLVAFALFEERQKEHERARVIYKYGLSHLPPERTADIFKHYTVHEKKYGERAGIEDVIVSKRRTQYEKQIAENAYNYDAWFDYLRLLENEECAREEVEDLYERAIANIPPNHEKRYWRRYIYLWINYALYEELTVHDIEKTRQVYKACLDIIPHKKFTFAKIWIMLAHFEIRQMDLTAARKILGVSIGKCPKEKLFRAYIDLELQLREFDRCRKLYEKFLEYSPENSNTWIKFAELETLLGDVERARAIFDIAIQQPALDMPEILWKAYIDFEINAEEYEKARDLYEALLQRTNHIKVWISLAEFEIFVGNIEGARNVYDRANRALENAEKEERLMLLEAWLESEKKIGDINAIHKVEEMMPRRVKKRRQIQTDDGVDAGWEEYYDYIFPQDQAAKGSFKLLEAAARWKKQREQMAKEAQAVADDRDVERANAGESDTESNDKVREGDSDTDIGSSSSSESDSESSSSSSDSRGSA